MSATTDLVTLEQLRDYARANATRVFNLDSCDRCLAAQLTGLVMAGSYRFEGDAGTVPLAFAEFTSRVGRHELTGGRIAGALDRIIAGGHPDQVADDVLHDMQFDV